MIKKIKKLYGSSLYKNAFFLVLNSVIMSVLGFFFWTINARNFDSKDVGLALTLISSMSLIANISILGFDDALIKFLGNSSKKDVKINSIYVLCGLTSLLVSILFLIFIKTLAPNLSILTENLFYVILFVVFTFFWTFFVLTDGVFIALRDSKYVLVKNSIFSVLKLIFPFLLLSLGYLGIFTSWTTSALIAFLFILLILPKRFEYRPKIRFDYHVIKEMFLFSFSNYIMRILMSAPGLLLPLLITNFLSAEKTAYFYIAWMMSEFLAVIPNSISTSLFAETSYNIAHLEKKLRSSIKISYMFLIPILIVLILFHKILLGFFGAEYVENSSMLLLLLAITSIPSVLSTSYITLNRVKKNIKRLIWTGIYFFIVFLSLCLVFIKYFDIIGIGIAWLTTNLIFALYVLNYYGNIKNDQRY